MQSPQASSRPSGISAHRDWRVPFATHYAAYRRKVRRRIIAVIAVGAIYALLVILHLVAAPRGIPRSHTASVLWEVSFIPMLVACALVIFFPRLYCPRCDGNLQRRWKNYCSECGSGKVHQPPFIGWRLLPRCDACGREPVHPRGGRQYVIRFCTHCGAYVHETGV